MEVDLASFNPPTDGFQDREKEVVEDSLDQVMELIKLAKNERAILARKAVVELSRLLEIQPKNWVH